MGRIHRLAFLIIISGLAPLSAQAEGFFLFQPAVGYQQGHYDLYAASGIAVDLQLGFRLGKSFYLAGDAMYGMPSLSATAPASGSGYAATLMDMGGTLGWDLGKGQITFTYIFDAKLSWSDSSGINTVNSGAGYKLGLSLEVIKDMLLGLSATFDSYTTQSVDGTSTKTPNFYNFAFISLGWRVW
ncbi:MAG: hypothetical protein AB7F86_12370 [Bdellovibrionales bacterium]